MQPLAFELHLGWAGAHVFVLSCFVLLVLFHIIFIFIADVIV